MKVSTTLPFPGEAMLVDANVAVTPVGSPLTDRLTLDLKPLAPLVLTETGVEPPGATLTLVAPRDSVKSGGRTVKLTVWVFVTPPPVAETVTG